MFRRNLKINIPTSNELNINYSLNSLPTPLETEADLANNDFLKKSLVNSRTQAKARKGFPNSPLIKISNISNNYINNNNKNNNNYIHCKRIIINSSDKIGKGVTSSVYKIKWKKVRCLFSRKERFRSSELLDLNKDYIALKIVSSMNELIQMGFWKSRHERTIENLSNYFQDFSLRSERIYNYLQRVIKPSLGEHISEIYGCSYCYNNNFKKTSDLSEQKLPSLLIAQSYLANSKTLLNYFNRIDIICINLIWIKHILLQGIYLIFRMSSMNFYHNDLNMTNILVTETDCPIHLKIPLLNVQTTINTKNLPIPLLVIIDFDLASIDYPRDNDYRYQSNIKLPIIDLITFITNIYNGIKKSYNKNNKTISKDIENLFLSIFKKLENLCIFEINTLKFSRGEVIVKNGLTESAIIDIFHNICHILIR